MWIVFLIIIAIVVNPGLSVLLWFLSLWEGRQSEGEN